MGYLLDSGSPKRKCCKNGVKESDRLRGYPMIKPRVLFKWRHFALIQPIVIMVAVGTSAPGIRAGGEERYPGRSSQPICQPRIEQLASLPCHTLLVHPNIAKFGGLYPAYVRGQAYLETGKGREAAVEFQKVFDHRGIVFADPIRNRRRRRRDLRRRSRRKPEVSAGVDSSSWRLRANKESPGGAAAALKQMKSVT